MKSRYLKSQKGQNLVEFAVILPIFVIMVLGVIDLSRAMYISYAMHRLSREGANLATRGNLLYTRVRTTMQESARPLTMSGNGAIYIYRIKAVADGSAQVEESAPEPTQTIPSQLGRPAPVAGVTLSDDQLRRVMNGQPFSRGQVIVLVETYYLYSNLTPIGGFISSFSSPSQPRVLGSKAVFYISS